MCAGTPHLPDSPAAGSDFPAGWSPLPGIPSPPPSHTGLIMGAQELVPLSTRCWVTSANAVLGCEFPGGVFAHQSELRARLPVIRRPQEAWETWGDGSFTVQWAPCRLPPTPGCLWGGQGQALRWNLQSSTAQLWGLGSSVCASVSLLTAGSYPALGWQRARPGPPSASPAPNPLP